MEVADCIVFKGEKLKVKVNDAIPSGKGRLPVVRIALEVTSSNKERYAYVGRTTFGVGFGYDLV